MKNYLYPFLFTILFNLQAKAQDLVLDTPAINLAKIAEINRSDNYITFPTDIGNLDPLFFEVNISPNFLINKGKKSRFMMVFTPQIIVRIFQEQSSPAKTPSYIPQISFYYNLKKNNEYTLFGRIAHHSNGQSGSFYNEDGEINLDSGNFSTNYIEFGAIKANYNSIFNGVNFFKTSLEIHPKFFVINDLHGIYSRFRWNNTYRLYTLKGHNQKNRPSISLKLDTTWMLDDINNWTTFDPKRFTGSITLYYHPEFLEDFGLFMQYYHGMDYYNINFSHQLNVIRFGIMTNKLSFNCRS